MAVSPSAVAGSAANAQSAIAAQSKATAALKQAIVKANAAGGVNPGLLGAGKAQSVLDQFKSAVAGSPFANVLVTGLNELERPAQAILHGIEGRNGGVTGVLHGALQGLAGSNNGIALNPNNEINLGQAVGVPMFENAGYTQQQAEAQTGNLGGNLGGIANFAGGTALDPLTYVTAGVGGVAKSGLRAVAAEAGTDTAARVAAQGTKSLAPEETSALRMQLSTTQAAKQWAVQNAGKTTTDYADKVLSDLHDPQGVKFAGRTVLPTAPLKAGASAAAERTGVAGAARAVIGTEVGQAAKGLGQSLVNVVKPGAQIARSISEGARNATQRVTAAAQHAVGIDTADMGRQGAAAINGVKNPGEFLKSVVGPALETGTVDSKAAELRAAGQEPEAHLLETFRDVYQQGLTKQRLQAGIVRPSQLHDMDTHMPMVPTPDARKYIEEHPAEAERLGYKQQANGVLRNAEPAFRKLQLDTVAERNAYMAEKTGVPEFFHADPVHAYSALASQTAHDAVTSSILDGLTKEKFEGKPLAIRAPDASAKLATIKSSTKESVRQLEKQASAVKRALASEKPKEAVHAFRSKATAGAIEAARKQVDTLESKVEKLEHNPAAPARKQLVANRERLVAAKKDLAALEDRSRRLGENTPASSAHVLSELQDQIRELKAGGKERTAAAKARAAVPVPEGYVKVDAGPKGAYYMPKAIAQHVIELDKFTGSEAGTRALGKAFSGLQAAWKNIQLNFGPLAIARIERDAMSNMIQMAEKGFTNRGQAYQRAWKITRALRSLPAIGSDVMARDAALREAGLDARDIDIVRQMDREGAWAGGRYSGGELHHTNALLDAKGKAARVLDLRKAEGPLTKHAESLNDFSDKFSRTAMFIDHYTKTGDAREAANAVDDALFNYNDLTKQEQAVRKYAIAFYTFTKKNAVLQAWTATHNPRALETLERARESAMSASNDQSPVPGYALAEGQVPFGHLGGTELLSGFDTPDLAANSALQPFADIASALPGMPHGSRTVAGAQGGAQGLLSNFAGVGPNLLGYAASQASGNNLYNGAPIKATDTGRIQDLLSAFLPRYSSSETTINNISGADANKAQAVLKLLGMPSIANTPQKQASTIKGETADITAELAAEGITNKKTLAAALKANAKKKS